MMLMQLGMAQRARKFKKVQAKKTLEIKKINFTKVFFGQISFFAISKMAKKVIFELGKRLKLPEMQFQEKIICFI